MKSLYIIIFILAISNLAFSQTSADQLARKVAQLMAKNDTTSLFKLLPKYQHLMAYFKKHGVPMPSDEEIAASKVVYENSVIKELKEDLVYERESCIKDGFDWSKMTIADVLVKKEEEEYQEGTDIFLTTHMITLHLKDVKNKFSLELAAFEVGGVFKLLNILDTNLESL